MRRINLQNRLMSSSSVHRPPCSPSIEAYGIDSYDEAAAKSEYENDKRRFLDGKDLKTGGDGNEDVKPTLNSI